MSTMKIKGRGIGRKLLFAFDVEGYIAWHTRKHRSLTTAVNLAGWRAVLMKEMTELFAGITDKIHDVGPRAVYSYNDEDALVFQVFAAPDMTVNTLDLIEQLIDHDLYAGLGDLLMKHYPVECDPDEEDHSDDGREHYPVEYDDDDEDERVEVRRVIESEDEPDCF